MVYWLPNGAVLHPENVTGIWADGCTVTVKEIRSTVPHELYHEFRMPNADTASAWRDSFATHVARLKAAEWLISGSRVH